MENSILTNLFLAVFLLSFPILAISLIKPSVFKKFIKITPKRKTIVLAGFATIVFSFIGIGLFIPRSSQEPIRDHIQEIVNDNTENSTVNTDQNFPEEQIDEPINQEVAESDKGAIAQPVSMGSASKSESNQPTETIPQTQRQSQELSKLDQISGINFYSVVSVVDGDTFKVSIDGKTETLRLIGINTPETVDPRKPVECFGKEASNKAKQLLTGQKVRLEADPTQDDRDIYGRLLRYAWLEDGIFFNKAMISEGYAYEYTYKLPYKYQSEFKQAQAEAENNKRGLWADNACQQAIGTTVPVQPSNSQPTGHTFYTSSYHTATFYYCDTDETWKGLKPEYLKSFFSENELLKAYPTRRLHEPCN